jgi:phytoene synthase
MVNEYRMPRRVFDDVIAGQRQDLEPEPFETFAQLHEYCYRVAGVVGLASIYIWGFEGGAETEALAVDRGVAFQLTNILRDLKEDAARGRTYLPREDLLAMNLTEEDLRSTRGGEKFLDLMRFQINRAESYYERSRPLENRIQRDSRPTLIAMTQIYHRLLKKVAGEPERVLRERVSLSLLSKLMIGWRAARAR